MCQYFQEMGKNHLQKFYGSLLASILISASSDNVLKSCLVKYSHIILSPLEQQAKGHFSFSNNELYVYYRN